MSDPGFGLDHLPYGAVRLGDHRTVAVARYTDRLLDLSTIDAELFASGSLDAMLAAGPETWRQVRAAAADAIRADRTPLLALDDATTVLPFAVADYVDFYASEQHATNAGSIFRPGAEPLTAELEAAARRLPRPGRHGGRVGNGGAPTPRSVPFAPPVRSSTHPPAGSTSRPRSGSSSVRRATPGAPVPVDRFAQHVFGVVLLNDWSARDIQGFESAPLGPHQGKSFATSVSAWITPLVALERAWRPPPARDIAPLRHLDDGDLPGGLDLELTVSINGEPVSRPPFATMYWTPGQLLAQLTANGAAARSGDLLGSGTVSGPDRDQFGSLLELSWNGTEPVPVGTSSRTWLEDGDEVLLTASAPANDGGRLELGEVRGRISPASASR